MTVTISVIIPCYNNHATIERAVQSVISDAYSSKEIIVVNDGSDDHSLETLTALKKRYPDQLVLINQENQGANVARNNGFRIARGHYIQFLDADDYLINDKLSRSIEVMQAKSNLCLVYTDGESDGDGESVQASHGNTQKIADKRFTEFTFGMNTNMPIFTADFLKESGQYWDEELSCWQESEYFFRLLTKMTSSEQIKHLAMSGFVRTNNQQGISSRSSSSRYIKAKTAAIEKIMVTCESSSLVNQALYEQVDRFMWLLFKSAVLQQLDDSVPFIRQHHRQKSLWQSLLYSIPPRFLRYAYKAVSLLR